MNTPGHTAALRVMHASDAFFRKFIDVWLVYSALLLFYTALWEPASLYTGVICTLCGLVAKFCLLQGYTTQVRWIFIVPFFIMLIVAPWFVNGIRTPLLMHMPLLIIFTGWMLGTRVLWSFTLALIASMMVLWYAETRGLWAMPQALRNSDMWLISLQFGLLVTSVTVSALIRNYRADIQRETTWQTRLQHAMQFNALIIDSSPVPIRVFGPQGQCMAVNQAYAKLMGESREALLLQNLHDSAMQSSGLTTECLHVLATGQATHREVQAHTSDGRGLWLNAHLVPFEREGQRHLLAHFIDMSEYRRATQELQQLAFYDSLTGLANRRLLWEHFQRTQLQCHRKQQWGGLLLLDLNRFKLLNDLHGHAAGDLMLQEVAQRLQRTVRASDVIARLGGDEFTLLLPDLGSTEQEATQRIHHLCDKLQTTLSQPYHLGPISHHASASIGAALMSPLQEQTLDHLLRQADLQMYAQKKTQTTPSVS